MGQIYTRMAMGEDHTNPDLVFPHPSLKSLGAQLTSLQSALPPWPTRTSLTNR